MSRRSQKSEPKLTGRGELLNWLNTSLHLSYIKIEETANGAAFCQIIDMIHPGTVPLGRVNFNAILPHERLSNLKILQEAFTKNKITGNIEVEALSKGRYVAALHLLQFLHSYASTAEYKDYDPVARREQYHCAPPGIRKAPKSPKPGGVPMMAKSLKKRNFLTIEEPKQTEEAAPEIVIAKLKSTLSSLMKQYKKMKEEAEMMTQERDFYYEKLRKVEDFCQDHEEDPAYGNVLNILYETDEALGFVSPEEAELQAEEDEMEEEIHE